MSWSKLKTIIILILLLLNLFLLALVGVNQIRSSRYQATALQEAAAVLEFNGIQVDRSGLPAAMELPAAIAARDVDQEARLARALLDDNASVSTSGGGLYVYTSASGEASFRSTGEFSVTFTQPIPVEADRQSQVRTLLEELGLSLWQLQAQEDAVTATQSVNGAPVFSSGIASAGQSAAEAVFSYDPSGALASVSGRLLLGPVSPDPDAQTPLTVPTVLISFFGYMVENGDVCQSILTLTQVYRAAAMTEPVRLTPAWRISTDTGDYFLDAYTAEVTRVAAE